MTMQTNQRTPVKIVIRSRFRSTTDDDPRDDETPPPNRSDSPPPLPLCSNTSTTMSRLVMIRTIEIAMVTAGSGPLRAFAQVMALRSRYLQILTNSPASRLAPPTKPPSMSGCAMIAAMLSGFTDPPYRIRAPAATPSP